MTDDDFLRDAPFHEPLTQRELDIVSLIAEGMTNREIGSALHLAEKTIRWHNTQIFDKLGVTNRLQAVSRAQALGLLGGEEEEPATYKHNLPWQTTMFVGREQEMSELGHLLSNAKARLITILGTGGMGKTRLALEAARAQLSRFADGVYFVPLAPLSAAEHIVPAIAEQVGIQFHREGNPQEQLLRYFARKRMLLVLDNFEHLLDGASFVTEILGAAPGITILATSREKLALSGETIYAIGGMPLPDLDGAEATMDYSAVGLFIQSARRAYSDFALRGDDLHHVARICQLVEGMPLALLMAATWVDVLSLEEIAEEIGQSLDLLQTDLRDMPAHQRSIRATFNRSWQRLSAVERGVFMRLSVFRGGCTREAVQAVTSASLSVLHALVNKSLLWRLPDGRYDIHELLRQYAAERLETAGDTGPARDAHSAYFMAFAHSLEAQVKSRRQAQAFARIEADFENIRRGWNWATEKRNYDGVGRALECVFLYCEREGRFKEGMELFAQAREALAPRPGEEPHLVWARALIHFQSDKGQIEQGLAIAKQHNAVAEIAWCYQLFGEWAFEVGDHKAAADWWQYRVDLLQSIEGWFDIVLPLEGLGYSLLFLRRIEEAIKAFELAIELGNRSGNMSDLAKAMTGYASIRTGEAGAYAEAEQILAEAIALQDSQLFGSGRISVHAQLLLMLGDIDQARHEAQGALDAAVEFGVPVEEGWSLAIRAKVAYADGDYAKAKIMAEEAVSLRQARWFLPVGNLILALACIGVGANKKARRCGMRALELGAAIYGTGWLLSCLQISTLILANDAVTVDDRVRVARMLGLIFTHPASPKKYFEQDLLLTRLRKDLKCELGAEAYAAAWEEGRKLEVDKVVTKLLVEYRRLH